MRRVVGRVLAFTLLGGPSLLSAGDDPTRRLAGTWGLPPDDANPYASGFGSYFFLSSEAGQLQARLFLYAKDWDCRQDGAVTWNTERGRFEWPNRSSSASEKVCWFSAEPAGDRLKVAIRCSYQCTDAENTHELVLDRIATERLEPPPDVSAMFCSSHDALRQALCHPGPLHQGVARARRAADQLHTLSVGGREANPDSAGWGAETKKALLRILASCRASGGGVSCLKSSLDDDARRLEAKVAERQKMLAEERARSRAAEARIGSADRLAWEGTRYQDNDELFTTLTIEHCGGEGCQLSLSAETNYAFGCTGDPESDDLQCRTGSCWLESADFRFTGANTAYGYVEPKGDAANEAEAGPFANHCRFDLERGEGRVRLELTGVGCQWLCGNAPFGPMRGDYGSPAKPSFDCGKDMLELAMDERAICMDADLAALDRDLAQAFARTRARLKGSARDALLESQRSFLKRRRDCEGKGHRDCLVSTYQDRLKELAALVRP